MGRFSLKRVAKVLVNPASDDVNRITEPDATWEAWAAEHGFTYRFDGSEFEGGRYFEPVPEGYGHGEQCFGVIEGTCNGLGFTFVARKTWNVGGRMTGPPSIAGALVIDLPGKPIPELLQLTPDEAFKAAGGELPRTGTFAWRPPAQLFGHGHWVEPNIVEGILQSISLQLGAAPAEIWQR